MFNPLHSSTNQELFEKHLCNPRIPSDKCNSITAKAIGLIFSLFNVALAREVPFGIPQYIQCILHGLLPMSSFVVKSVDLAVAHDDFSL